MGFLDRKEKATLSEESDVSVSVGDAEAQQAAEADGVFGAGGEKGAPNYINVGWFRASILLMKAQIGLGVLGIPQVFSTVGLIPGILMLVVIAIMTSWSSYIVGRFKLRHPEVHSIADVGYILAGPFGREFLGATYTLYMLCISGSGMLSVSIALNTLSEHGTCTVVFVAVAAIAVFLLSSIQTLDRVSFLGWVGLVSIMASLITLAVSVGIEERPAAAPPAPAPWSTGFKLFGSPTFAEAGAALGTVVFAFGGTPAFLSVVAEMRRPKDFAKTVITCQGYVTVVYLAIGIVVYKYCGDYVASPALGSSGRTYQKICYGLAIPALIVGSVIYTHLPAKYVFVRMLRGTRHLASNTVVHWTVWIGSVLGATVVAFVIAEGIPVFSGLVGLVGALFGTTMSITTMGAMWLFDNNWGARNAERRRNKSFKYRFLVVWNYWMILAGVFVTIAGTYGSIVGIINDYSGKSLTAFSCADNS